MRKIIVAIAMVLASTTAQAEQIRSLTRADVQVAAIDQAKPVDASKASEATKSSEAATAPDAAKPADPPKFLARPAAVEPARPQPAPPRTDATELSTSRTAKTDRPRRKHRDWTESRIIGELHRHGIYW